MYEHRKIEQKIQRAEKLASGDLGMLLWLNVLSSHTPNFVFKYREVLQFVLVFVIQKTIGKYW